MYKLHILRICICMWVDLHYYLAISPYRVFKVFRVFKDIKEFKVGVTK